MSVSEKVKQNQTPREYLEINGFELRIGEFYDPNRHLNGAKMEIRILRKIDEDALDGDMDIFYALVEKIKEYIST